MSNDQKQALLQVRDINTFYEDSQILSNVSLKVSEGEIVVLLGRNGAGKTTTLRSIMGLTPPRSGSISLHGREIQDVAPFRLRRRGLSWVPEEREIFTDLTVEENLVVASFTDDQGANNINDVFKRFPVLRDRRQQPAGTLSGGEQQMLAIARSIIGPDIKLLMLDEPTEGLAPQIIDDVLEIIRDIHSDGNSILLVEQNVDVALELADRIYIIDQGRIKYHGTADDLASDDETIEQLLGV
jgi:branched-chain amino acid transport system ATP-binding protein